MPFPTNTIVIAAAGSGKTTRLVDQALSRSTQRLLVTTFTLENLDQIRTQFVRQHGCVPSHVTLLPWYTFLLKDCIRPYQGAIVKAVRIGGLYFDVTPSSAARIRKSDNPARYYLTSGNRVYRDRASEFACDSNARTDGGVVARLEGLYDAILIDELQDLAGYDLDLLDLLFDSRTIVIGACDPRQSILATNLGRKNGKYHGDGIATWLQQPSRSQKIDIQELVHSHRCNQLICDFADALFPDLPKTVSLESRTTGHDGIVLVERHAVLQYIDDHQPVILRYRRNSNTMGLEAVNIGVAKGSTFPRVLIFPTKPMLKYLTSKNLVDVGDLPRLYVAVTRAKYSVAFVID